MKSRSLFFILFFVSFITHGQGLNWKLNQIGFQAGATMYHGDLCDGLSCQQPSFNIGLYSRYVFTDYYSIRPRLNIFRLQGDDANGSRPERNLNFRSDNVSFFTDFVWDLTPNKMNTYSRSVLQPYLLVGIGFLWFNPKTEYNGEWVALQPLQTEGKGYSRFAFAASFGLGLRFKVSKYLSFGLEVSIQPTTTDYLDDVSGEYVNNKTLLGTSAILADRTNELGIIPDQTSDGVHWQEGTARGNTPKIWDGFSLISFQTEIDLVRAKVKCPEI